jgi:predicted RNA-binding protein with RPS1 domain
MRYYRDSAVALLHGLAPICQLRLSSAMLGRPQTVTSDFVQLRSADNVEPQVGQKVKARILEVHPAEKKVMLTLKASLVKSKLVVVNSLAAAAPGTKTHGFVTGAQKFGVFVCFCGGVKGLAHVSELGLVEGQSPVDAFQVGQVVRCHVLAVDAARGSLKLSLVSKKGQGAAATEESAPAESASDPLGGLQAGDIVQGTISQVQETAGKLTFTLQVGLTPVHVCACARGRAIRRADGCNVRCVCVCENMDMLICNATAVLRH